MRTITTKVTVKTLELSRKLAKAYRWRLYDVLEYAVEQMDFEHGGKRKQPIARQPKSSPSAQGSRT